MLKLCAALQVGHVLQSRGPRPHARWSSLLVPAGYTRTLTATAGLRTSPLLLVASNGGRGIREGWSFGRRRGWSVLPVWAGCADRLRERSACRVGRRAFVRHLRDKHALVAAGRGGPRPPARPRHRQGAAGFELPQGHACRDHAVLRWSGSTDSLSQSPPKSRVGASMDLQEWHELKRVGMPEAMPMVPPR